MTPMRRSIAGHTTLAVLLAFITAPFLHFHAAGTNEHDGGHEHEATVHAHVADADSAADEHGDHDAEFSGDGHDARPLGVFAVLPSNTSLLTLPFLTAERTYVAPAQVSVERPTLQSAPRTHDPPLLAPSIPRAPPA